VVGKLRCALFRANRKIEVIEVSNDRVEKRRKKVLDTIKGKNEKYPISREEWEDLMGMNKPTYKRHKGAIRRK
jgi:hypothetical protein